MRSGTSSSGGRRPRWRARIITTLIAWGMLPALIPALTPWAGLGAQARDTEFHGGFHHSIGRWNPGDADTRWSNTNNSSRLGVRSETGQGAFTAFLDLQVGVAINRAEPGETFTPRFHLVGVRTPGGTFTVGRHSPAYKTVGVNLDPFWDTATLGVGGTGPASGALGGGSFGLSPLTSGWADRGVTYTSPYLGGARVNGVVHMNPQGSNDLGAGVEFRRGGITTGLQWEGVSEDSDAWIPGTAVKSGLRTHLSYQHGGWNVGGNHERFVHRDGTPQDFLYGSGRFQATPRVRLAWALARVTSQDGVTGDGTGLHVGTFVTLLPGAEVHALWSRVDLDGHSVASHLAAGVRYTFSLRGSSDTVE